MELYAQGGYCWKVTVVSLIELHYSALYVFSNNNLVLNNLILLSVEAKS